MTRRQRLGTVLGCLVALAIGLASAPPVRAVSDWGHPAISRLWSVDESGDRRFACTAAYLHPGGVLPALPSPFVRWVLSAGHCAEATILGRDTAGVVFAHVDWRLVVQANATYLGPRVIDFALGTAPETREDAAQRFLWVAEAFPAPGTLVYLHGFPFGVERVTAAIVADPSPDLPSRRLIVRSREVDPGSSGSPVLDGLGRLVGVVWGRARGVDGNLEFDEVFVTGVDDLLQSLRPLVGNPG